jgi:pyrroline-5-carboxylate reductase
MKKSIGFIGGGRITGIFLQAFSNKKVEFSRIVVDEINNDVRLNLSRKYKNFKLAEGSVAASQDIVFIALHPPIIMDTLELLKGNFKSSTVVISLAPKISLEKISSKLPKIKKIARLIPNATSYINEGFNPVCFSEGFGKSEKNEILEILGILGKTIETPEVKLESYAIMSAMLPTYFWFQWKELAEIGQKIGLNEKESVESIHETLAASLNLMYKSGLTPHEVMDLIPVKPIAEHESQITDFYNKKLIGLYEKIKP